MKPSTLPARSAVNLRNSIHQRLNMYTLAATAGGVGVLAASPAADAKIVYTPTHEIIRLHHKVLLDLNHDGKNDFTIHEAFITTTSVDEFHSLILSVLPARRANEILGMGHKASALKAGVRVGPKGRFSYAKKTLAVDFYADGTGGSGTCSGPWNNVKNRYLGLKFSINGETHFGWARLNVACITTFEHHEVKGLLTGYAYETVPNKPIVTGRVQGTAEPAPSQAHIRPAIPEPATLGVLAMGSNGLSIWRRKEDSE